MKKYAIILDDTKENLQLLSDWIKKEGNLNYLPHRLQQNKYFMFPSSSSKNLPFEVGSHCTDGLWLIGGEIHISITDFLKQYKIDNLKELPKEWCVKNDGSQLFKDTVIKYCNSIRKDGYFDGTCHNEYYGFHREYEWDIMQSSWGTELTIQQFIKLTTKEISTDKKIIGYKLIKEYPGSPDLGTVSQTMIYTTFTEFWEPVYETKSEFKVGDWVVFEYDRVPQHLRTPVWCKRMVLQIAEIPNTVNLRFEKQIPSEFRITFVDHGKEYFRLATKQEILNSLLETWWTQKKSQNYTIYNDTLKVYSVEQDGLKVWKTGKDGRLSYGSLTSLLNDWRPATQEEIKAAEKNPVKIFKMSASNGNFELEVSKDGIFYRPENAWLSTAFSWGPIIDLKLSYEKVIGQNPDLRGTSYTVKPTKINVGCKQDCLISEWQEVYKYYNSIK